MAHGVIQILSLSTLALDRMARDWEQPNNTSEWKIYAI